MRITILVVILLLASVVFPRAARAAEAEPDAPKAIERDVKETEPDDAVDVGVLGGVGFPRPLSIEAVVGLRKTLMLGAEYGFMPKTTISSVDVRMWSAAADLRFFPFRGAFFIGLRGGYQSVSAEATLSAANVGSYTESVDVGTWFVNPRVGFLWVWKPLALGVDVGVQIPLSTTVSRSSLLAAAAPEVDANVNRAIDALGRTVIPTVDLLRIGLVF